MTETTLAHIETPIGRIGLVASQAGLCRILFPGQSLDADRAWFQRHFGGQPRRGAHPLLEAAGRQLRAYFEGSASHFAVALDLHGSSFQCRVWRRLAQIPRGRVVSYGELASWIDRPRAVRAVGAANGANPLPVVLPCHRVVGANGSLTGFGGGLDLKIALLELEGVVIRPHPSGHLERFRVADPSSRQGELWP